MSLRVAATALALLLAACAAPGRRPAPPPLPDWVLAPATLPAVQLNQQLHVELGSERRRFEALLEIDTEALRLVAFAAQQPAFRLFWDGVTLEAEQAHWLPAEVRPQSVLNDLFLLLAPAELLRAQLPAEFTLEESGPRRALRWRGHVLVATERDGARWTVTHTRLGYRLQIDSADAGMRP